MHLPFCAQISFTLCYIVCDACDWCQPKLMKLVGYLNSNLALISIFKVNLVIHPAPLFLGWWWSHVIPDWNFLVHPENEWGRMCRILLFKSCFNWQAWIKCVWSRCKVVGEIKTGKWYTFFFYKLLTHFEMQVNFFPTYVKYQGI